MASASTPWSFDPVALAGCECDAWVGYYRRDWWLVLRSTVRLVRIGFRLSWPGSLLAAWWVLRANQAWAPSANDPDLARAYMTRFYALVGRRYALAFDPVEAARLEVAWWRAHRRLARLRTDDDEAGLVAALVALYSHVYEVAPEAMRQAARDRARAMRVSDAWVIAGRDPGDPLLIRERDLLVRSYSLLLAAIRSAGDVRREPGELAGGRP